MPNGVEVFTPSFQPRTVDERIVLKLASASACGEITFDWERRMVVVRNLLKHQGFLRTTTIPERSLSFDADWHVTGVYSNGMNCLKIDAGDSSCLLPGRSWEYEELRDRFALIREIGVFDHDASWRSWRTDLPYIVGLALGVIIILICIAVMG